MQSIRTYLVIVILSTVCLGNFTAALHGYRSSMLEAERLLDRQVLEAHDQLQRLLAAGIAPPVNLLADHKLFQLYRHGVLTQHSANAASPLLGVLHPGLHMLNHAGQRWRVFVHRDPTADTTWLVGEQADLYSRMLEQLTLTSILPIIWILPLLGALILLIVTLGLRPLRRLARLLSARSPNDLSAIDSAQFPGELSTVVLSTNQLFARLQEAFERERRFSADAAHELRTPLTALKIGLHNLAAEQDLEPVESYREVVNSVERMAHSIEQLLALNSLAPEDPRGVRERVNLLPLAQRVIVELYELIEMRQQQVELDGEAAWLWGNAFALETLLRNLVDNACKYTPVGGKIIIRVVDEAARVLIVVEDSGPGVAPELRGRVFDRFYRVGGDGHASGVSGSGVSGSGLGLSIVRHAVQLHRGQIELGRSPTYGGLAVTVTLPVNPEPNGTGAS